MDILNAGVLIEILSEIRSPRWGSSIGVRNLLSVFARTTTHIVVLTPSYKFILKSRATSIEEPATQTTPATSRKPKVRPTVA